jgi:hypothetical protein
MATLEEQLASVQAAIESIEGCAQSVTDTDGSRVDRAQLETLYRREERLLKRIGFRDNGRVRAAEI